MRSPAVLAALALSVAALPAARANVAEAEVQSPARAMPHAAPLPAASATVLTLPPAVPPKALGESRPGAPLQLGFGREVPALATPESAARHLSWERAANGASVAAIRIESPGAQALRAALRVESLPPGTRLSFQGREAEPFVVPTGSIPVGPAYWGPVVEGDAVTITIEVPATGDPASLRLAIPQLSHLAGGASTGFLVPKAASACQVDIACHPEWSTESKAVARILFSSGGDTFTCSGVLVADQDAATTIPYLLTANHCISSAAAAATVQAYWFYRSTACDSGALNPSYQVTTGGGTLLYDSSITDSTLIQLHETPPTGAIYSGWIVGQGSLPEGTRVTGIHHPAGDEQKVSRGDVRGYFNCSPSALDPTELVCHATVPETSTFYAVAWTEGTVEGGSSGGGIFRDDGHYLLGQIYGGNGSCTAPGWTYAGRFDVAFEAGLSRWLGTPGVPAAQPAEAAPLYDVTDLWWNAAESGWGLSLTQHGTEVFGAWFAYDDAGRPRWIVMPGGTWTDESTLTGDLYATSGPDGLGPFDPRQVERTRIGRATLSFQDRDHAVLGYIVEGASGAKAITRQPFGQRNSIATGTYGDLWWNASESGWGLSVSQQFGTLFAVWYTYAADGRPVWYVMPGGQWVSGEAYTGTLYRTSEPPGAFFGGTFDPALVSRIPVGSMTLRFTAPGTGTMSYVVDGVGGERPIARQPF